MKHLRCSSELKEVAFNTFKYWYCKSCKEEVLPDQCKIEVSDLPNLGWSYTMYEGERCWTFGDNEYTLAINDQEAIEIHKLMANGMGFSDAVIMQLLPID